MSDTLTKRSIPIDRLAYLGPTRLGKLLGVSKQRADQLLHPEKQRARRDSLDKRERGIITRPTVCSNCGAEKERIEAHHSSYEEGGAIQWLCVSCHRKIPRPRKLKSCHTCGSPIKSNRKYCSAECKSAPYRVTLPCPSCGKPISISRKYFQWRQSHVQPGNGKPQQQVFCSKSCLSSWIGKHYGRGRKPQPRPPAA